MVQKRYEAIYDALYETGIVPVIRLEETKHAGQLARTLEEGDMRFAEVTFRAAGAADVIEQMRAASAQMLVGAGTVLTLEEARSAADAGAAFLVSPGFDRDVVTFAQSRDLPVFPGCVTPTEIQMALGMGLTVLKFFPAAQYGGIDTMKALSGPFPQVRWMPTGGISLANLPDYLRQRSIIACGGTFMVKEELLRTGNWDEIRARCLAARAIAIQCRS